MHIPFHVIEHWNIEHEHEQNISYEQQQILIHNEGFSFRQVYIGK